VVALKTTDVRILAIKIKKAASKNTQHQQQQQQHIKQNKNNNNNNEAQKPNEMPECVRARQVTQPGLDMNRICILSSIKRAYSKVLGTFVWQIGQPEKGVWERRDLPARDKCQKNLTMRSSVSVILLVVVHSDAHFLCIEKCFVRVFVLMVSLTGTGERWGKP